MMLGFFDWQINRRSHYEYGSGIDLKGSCSSANLKKILNKKCNGVARTCSIFFSTDNKTIALKFVCFTPLNRKVTTIINIFHVQCSWQRVAFVKFANQSINQSINQSRKTLSKRSRSLRRFVTNHFATTMSRTDRKCDVFKEKTSTLWRVHC